MASRSHTQRVLVNERDSIPLLFLDFGGGVAVGAIDNLAVLFMAFVLFLNFGIGERDR
jgi:hypothetical protein